MQPEDVASMRRLLTDTTIQRWGKPPETVTGVLEEAARAALNKRKAGS